MLTRNGYKHDSLSGSHQRSRQLLCASRSVARQRRAQLQVHSATASASKSKSRTLDRLPRWDGIHKYLTDKSVQSVPPGIADQLTKTEGYLLVDVRPKESYEKAHIAGSVNVPVFQKVNFLKPRPSSILRTIALTLNGVTPIEANLDFVEGVEAAAGPQGKVILTCEAGGTLQPNSSFPWGKESRSLKAIFKLLVDEGGQLDKVRHLDGGVYAWHRRGLPMVGEYDSSEVGRTASAVVKKEEDSK